MCLHNKPKYSPISSVVEMCYENRLCGDISGVTLFHRIFWDTSVDVIQFFIVVMNVLPAQYSIHCEKQCNAKKHRIYLFTYLK